MTLPVLSSEILVYALWAVVIFLVTRAIGGVVSEYSKRAWFGHIEPKITKLFGRNAALPSKLETEFHNLKQAHTELTTFANDVWRQNEEKDATIARLEVENHLLRAELAKSPAA